MSSSRLKVQTFEITYKMTEKNKTPENQAQCAIQNVVCSIYALRFNEPDSNGNVIFE